MDRVSALHHTRTFEIVHPEKFLRIGPDVSKSTLAFLAASEQVLRVSVKLRYFFTYETRLPYELKFFLVCAVAATGKREVCVSHLHDRYEQFA